MTPQDMVREFYQRFGVPMHSVPITPHQLDPRVYQLRRDLIEEEHREFQEAMDAYDLVEVADALADMIYVIYGTALTFGINLDAVIAEVHRSNMTKEGDGSIPTIHKITKGDSYDPPDIEKVLRRLG